MSPDRALERLVPHKVRERGDLYALEGRVFEMELDGGVITATVQGSRVYQVELVPDDEVLTVFCECRYYQDHRDTCKHIWATMREASRRRLLKGNITALEFDSSAAAFAGDEPADPPRLAKGSRPPEKWKSFFDALPRVNLVEIPRTPPSRPEEILFVVQAHSVVVGSVSVLLRQRSRKKNGEWSQPRALSIPMRHLSSLDREEREFLLLLNSSPYGFEILPSEYRLRPETGALLLERIARSGRLWMERLDRSLVGPLRWDEGEPWQLAVEAKRIDSGGYRIEGAFVRSGESLPLSAAELVLPTLLFTADVAASLVETDALPWVDPLRKAGSVEIPPEQRDALLQRLLYAPPGLRLPDDLAVVHSTSTCVAVLRLASTSLSGESLEGRPVFRYGDREVAPSGPTRAWIEGKQVVRRDLAAEQARLDQLVAAGLTRDYYGGYLLRPATLATALPRLLELGWSIEVEGKSVRVADELSSEFVSGIDWFDLEGGARFGKEQIAIPRLLDALDRRRPLLPLADGSVGIVPEEWLAQFTPVADLAEKAGTALRFRRSQSLLIDALLRAQEGERETTGLESIKAKITGAREVAPVHESAEFRGSLRPYQREGLGWLHYLRETGIGGCLADDMGLGKTVQVLALLDEVSRKSARPSLVVAPRSLLFNWKQEAERFTPGLRVLEHHGQERFRSGEGFEGWDLVLTTYGTLRRDALHLSRTEFEYVILDESQAIKNATSQVSKSVRLLRAAHRLALSGTPIENHIGELWSLFEFLNPGMLGPARWFQRNFAARTVDPRRRQMLGGALRPLILRRTKEQVASELPARTEQTLYCELEPAQRKQYDDLRLYYRSTLLESVRNEGMARSKMHVLEALLRLRQAACHPALIDPRSESPSAKLDLLLEELSEVLESGHRALVFSQFTSFLRHVREALDDRGMEYLYLDGATRDRASLVEQFQQGDGPPVFLISLKAGGVGLNLTAADYVFLLDPWWNPAVEAQAIDRSHRIGQARPVVAYRLIARDTVEEKILELQSAKRDLAGAVITDENSILQTLDTGQLEQLLG